jgi:hypothetical protein
VQDEGEARTVSFGHGDMTPQWRDVLSWVQQHPAHRQELVDPLT